MEDMRRIECGGHRGRGESSGPRSSTCGIPTCPGRGRTWLRSYAFATRSLAFQGSESHWNEDLKSPTAAWTLRNLDNMKIKSLLLYIALALTTGRAVMADEACSLSVDVDIESLKYRACLRLATAQTEYDELGLVPIGKYLAPRGVGFLVEDGLGHLLPNIHNESGWSSAELYSGSLKVRRSFKKSSLQAVCGEWLEMSDALQMLEQEAKIGPEQWGRLKINYAVFIRPPGADENGVLLRGESPWIELPPRVRQLLRKKLPR